MRPIYVWWDKNFSKHFRESLLNALQEVIRLGEDFSDRFNVTVLGNFSLAEKYENADWYFDSTFDHGRNKVDASSVLDKCGRHWPYRPHIHVIGTSYDLWNGKLDNTKERIIPEEAEVEALLYDPDPIEYFSCRDIERISVRKGARKPLLITYRTSGNAATYQLTIMRKKLENTKVSDLTQINVYLPGHSLAVRFFPVGDL